MNEELRHRVTSLEQEVRGLRQHIIALEEAFENCFPRDVRNKK